MALFVGPQGWVWKKGLYYRPLGWDVGVQLHDRVLIHCVHSVPHTGATENKNPTRALALPPVPCASPLLGHEDLSSFVGTMPPVVLSGLFQWLTMG